jgi:S-DNA-T family DNA segregation ATPase FtsK/SpoIIIE
VSVPLSTVDDTVATRTRSSSSSRSRSSSTKPRPAAKGRGSTKASSTKGRATSSTRTTKGHTTSTRTASTRAAAKDQAPSALRMLVDGHGHDLWGVTLLILAVVVGVSVYTSSAGAAGDAVGSFVAALLGGLSYLVPPALAVAGVLLIRGPRERHIVLDDLDEDPDIVGTSHRNPAVVGLGAVLGVLVVAGVLDLLFAEQRTMGADGFGAYADGGGLLGAVPGGLAQVLGRWGALVVLVLLGIVAVSLVTGWSLRLMGQRVAEAVSPAVRAVGEWFSDLFNLGGEVDLTDAELDPAPEVSLYDQDADAPAKPKRTRKKKSPDAPASPAVHVADPTPFDPANTEQLEMGLGPAAEGSPWRLPPMKLLSVSGKRTIDTKAVEERGRVLEGALAEHGVETRLVGMVVGPTVTRYELELGVGVKVARLTSLHKDIAYAMASPDVRILAPIPGRQAIGVEVPNKDRQIVALGDILTSEEAHRATHPLEVGVGRDISGTSVLMNLATMPHLLIAGQTGAGKSSCINSIITSLLMRSTPEQVRMILIDPKQVELTQYNKIPHLLTQVVTNPKKAANALNWAVKEMERRYDLLSEVGVRDIGGYNAAYDRGDLQSQLGEDREFQRLPFILVVVDELADLMMVASRDVEESITRIAAKARAVGIHLVIATQRPSVNVITGVIKANIPARLAFAVASAMDSKVILDQLGAERLVGRGDMLLLGSGSSSPQRIQGSWVEESEVAAVVGQWRKQTPVPDEHYVQGVADEESAGSSGGGGGAGGGSSEDDDLLAQAMELVVRSGLGSTSMLQRKLKVGFARAGRLMDLLEQRGVVGPSEGSKARTVMMTPEELDNMIEAGEL